MTTYRVKPSIREHILRIIAFAVDSLIIAAVSYLFSVALLSWALNMPYGEIIFTVMSMLNAFLPLSIIYFTLMEGGLGWTLGKKLLGLRVEALSGGMGFTKALVRNVFRVIDSILLYAPVFLWWRRLGDYAAGTVVLFKLGEVPMIEARCVVTGEMYEQIKHARDRVLEMLRRGEITRSSRVFRKLEDLERFLTTCIIGEEASTMGYSYYRELVSKYGELLAAYPSGQDYV